MNIFLFICLILFLESDWQYFDVCVLQNIQMFFSTIILMKSLILLHNHLEIRTIEESINHSIHAKKLTGLYPRCATRLRDHHSIFST